MADIHVYSCDDRMPAELFEQFYLLMENSFPTTERRDHEGFSEELSRERFHLMCQTAANKLISVLTYYVFDGFSYVEHFAVNSEQRGQGIGSDMMKRLLSYADGKTVVLEVEPSSDGGIARHRIAFYERLGFVLNDYEYIQPPLMKGEPSIPLMIMSTPDPLSFEEFENIRDTLYKEVYGIMNN